MLFVLFTFLESGDSDMQCCTPSPCLEDCTASIFSEMNMQAVAYDILWHGTVSMAGALQWALLFLLHHPDKQAHAQDEIDANFPQGNAPLTAEERSKLPYLEAMVLEVGGCLCCCCFLFSMLQSIGEQGLFSG